MISTIHYLAMHSADDLVAAPGGEEVEWQCFRNGKVSARFYREVGRDWRWRDRAGWGEADWKRWSENGAVETWVGSVDGKEVGYFELARQDDGAVELAFLGLLPGNLQRGWGKVFLTRAVQRAWALPGTRRVWLHTCSEDHPAALANYQKRGFVLERVEQVPVPNANPNAVF
ncbi:MAG: GNAT family N-acetyltransferase [Akkermansiaceae bacterium]|jgi:GNAT superfamily N-acetyltransferase|nr:GNAT family N-acetyltransferase [Akkermansiaceae bacterium]